MTNVYFQIEFYSHLHQRWVPLLGREKTLEAAQAMCDATLRGQRRVVKVTQQTEVVSEGQ